MNFFGKLINKVLKITSSSRAEEKLEDMKDRLVKMTLKNKEKEKENKEEIFEVDLKPSSEKKVTRKPRKRPTKNEL